VNYIDISLWKLAIAALLMLINIALSFIFKLGLARNLLIATVRMVSQLLLVGLVLEYIFNLSHPLAVIAIALFMAGMAGASAVRRTNKRYAQIYFDSLFSIISASFFVSAIANRLLVIEPWYDPQYVIPLLGMILGNSLTGVSLALNSFLNALEEKQRQVEGMLALGATRFEAAHEIIKQSLRTAMIPSINAMMVMGIVSLPGMMTGQILAGAAPTDAVRYQILIMFMIISATALASFAVIMLAFRAMFTKDHRLNLANLMLKD